MIWTLDATTTDEATALETTTPTETEITPQGKLFYLRNAVSWTQGKVTLTAICFSILSENVYIFFDTDIDICDGGRIIDYVDYDGNIIRKLKSYKEINITSGAIISSPGYPDTNYPKEADCLRVINFQKETPYRIEFLGDFQLEYWSIHETKGFCADYVEIRNGVDVNDPLIFKGCTTKPNATNSFGSSVWIKFHSNWKNHKKGFSMKITELDQSEGKSIYEKAISLIQLNYSHFVTLTPISFNLWV